MFKLKIFSGKKEISYKPLSAALRFLIDEKKLIDSLRQLEKIFDVKLTEKQRKNFLSEDNIDVKISNQKGKPDEIVLSKVKLDEKFTGDYFRNYLAGFIQSIEKDELKYLHIFVPEYSKFKKYFCTEEYYYQTFIEGLALGNYTFDKYKSERTNRKDLSVILYANNEKKIVKAVSVGSSLSEGVYFARDLQNEPGNGLTPELLSKRIYSKFKKSGVEVSVFDEKKINKLKMGGLLAIGKGSVHPPRFIVLSYKPKVKKRLFKVALVGKGITFDSGGISLKSANNMAEMKADMSGAAVVAGTILAAADNRLPVELIGVIAAAENMPSGSSVKPGDVVKTMSGKTIEIDNTDAEGRVVLADALHYASKLKPDVIIDLATLTGACVVALGEYVAGLFSKNDKLADSLFDSGLNTNDKVWRMPMWDEFNVLNKSDVADIKNIGGKWGGAITAAKFLENFVDKNIPWAHLDIAGPALPNDLNNYTKKFMTGFGVRLLFDYLSKE